MTGGLSSLFVMEGRLRSGWRVGAYLVSYVVGLLIVQFPIGILYVALLKLQGAGGASELLAAMQPDRLPLWFYFLLKAAELVMLLPLTYVARRLLDRRDFASLGFRLDRGVRFDLIVGTNCRIELQCLLIVFQRLIHLTLILEIKPHIGQLISDPLAIAKSFLKSQGILVPL